MNKGKWKKFVHDHKKELILAGGVIIGVTLCAIGTKKIKFTPHKLIDVFPDLADNVDIPANFAVGEITDLWKEDGYLNAIVNGITTKDIGSLGEEFVKQGIVADDTEISMIVGFINKD